MKKEYNAVLELVKYNGKTSSRLLQVLEDKDINWIEVLGYLCYHRVAGLAYEVVNSADVRKLDFPVYFTLYMVHQAQSIRTQLQKKYIESIAIKLRESGTEHVFLKGSVLSSTIYPLGARAFNDLDILVSKRSTPDITKILKDLGFVQGKFDYTRNTIDEFEQSAIVNSLNNLGELAPFVKLVGETTLITIDVDVNFSLDWISNCDDETVDYFLKNRTTIPIDDAFKVCSLKEEHLFIHLCAHFYKEAILLDIVRKRKVLDLYKLVDIYTFIQFYFEDIDINKIFTDSRRLGLDNQVFYALNYTTQIFPEILIINNVKLLYQRYSYLSGSIMSIIQDQYNPEIKLEDGGTLIDRLFSYDIIKRYK